MHEISIAQSRYLTQDAVAAAILAVAGSVAQGAGSITVEFPIVPRSLPADWDAITYVTVEITASSRVDTMPSTALPFKPDAGQTIRIRSSTPGPVASNEDGELDYLGYEAL